MVFFELRKEDEYSVAALDHLVPKEPFRGYDGAVVLRGEGRIDDAVGSVRILNSKEGFQSTVGRGPDKESLIEGCPLANFKEIASGVHLGAMLGWSEANFSMFAFDMVARLNGTFKPGYVSSLHGMSWLNPDRKK